MKKKIGTAEEFVARIDASAAAEAEAEACHFFCQPVTLLVAR